MTVECINASLMKVRLQLTVFERGIFCGLLTSTENDETAVNNSFWLSVGKAVSAVPSGEHAVVMVGANARNGTRDDESTPDKVMGAYGRERRNEEGRRLVEFAGNVRISILDIFSAHSNAG